MTPLRPAAIEPYPRIRLQHANVLKAGWARALLGWDTYPLEIPRPDTGPTVCEVSCGTCGALVTLRVLDGKTTRARRRTLVTIAGLGILGFLVIVLSHIVVAFLPAFALLLAGVIAYNRWRQEDGVRFVDKPAKGHSIDFLDPPWMSIFKSRS